MPDKRSLTYDGFVPPCAIYCGTCPVFIRTKNACPGGSLGCKTRKCKGIYVCCVEKKGLEFCFQCQIYPCSRYSKFAQRWLKHGQNLLANQEYIKVNGKNQFIVEMNISDKSITRITK